MKTFNVTINVPTITDAKRALRIAKAKRELRAEAKRAERAKAKAKAQLLDDLLEQVYREAQL